MLVYKFIPRFFGYCPYGNMLLLNSNYRMGKNPAWQISGRNFRQIPGDVHGYLFTAGELFVVQVVNLH